jgi:hypothetical protein
MTASRDPAFRANRSLGRVDSCPSRESGVRASTGWRFPGRLGRIANRFDLRAPESPKRHFYLEFYVQLRRFRVDWSRTQ